RPRRLVVGQVGAAEVDYLPLELGAGNDARSRLHDGLDLLPHFRIGNAEDGDISHGGVQHQDVLDLLRVDVDPPRDDHEQLAVGQVQVTVVVDMPHVPQRGPALVVERLAG